MSVARPGFGGPVGQALLVLIFLVTCTWSGPPLSAQQLPDRNGQPRSAPAFYLGANVAVATASAWIPGRGTRASVRRALIAGAIGGTVMYAGQRLVGTADPALRLAGVQTVALGANLARNIGSGTAVISNLTFPLFPFYLTVQSAEPRVRVRVSTAALIGMVATAGEGRTLDVVESIYSGAMVFRHDGEQVHCYEWDGTTCVIARTAEHRFGSVAYASNPQPSGTHGCIAHEFGHITQDVRDAILYALPMSDVALRHGGGFGRVLSRYVVIDLFLPLMATSELVGPPGFDAACRNMGRFYECEAYALFQ